MFSARILWAVKILLVLHKASEAGSPLMKGRELQAACVGPDADTYISPYFTGTGGQNGLPDLRIPVGKNLLPMEPEPPPDAVRPDLQAGRRHA